MSAKITLPFQKTNSMPRFSAPAKQQRGVVLVIGLIMLLLMTLIGTAGMQTTSLEEKMAGNMRDRNLAFQAAETALEEGERFLATKSSVALNALDFTNCNGNNGLYPQAGVGVCPLAFWDTMDWYANGKSVLYIGNLAAVSTNPRYIIEDLGIFDCPGSAAGSNGCRSFRVTARATGGTADAVVMLQSVFQRTR